MALFSRIKNFVDGETILAADTNAEFNNILNNMKVESIYSASVSSGVPDLTQMRTMSSPGSVGSESIPSDLREEIRQLKYMIDQIVGGAQWYTAPSFNINSGVPTAGIQDGAVTTIKIADANVTLGKLAADSVDSSKIVNGSVTGTDIASATITGSNIASATIAGSNIASGTVTGTNIASGTVTSANIQDATIVNGDIADVTISHNKIGACRSNTSSFSGTSTIGSSPTILLTTSLSTSVGSAGRVYLVDIYPRNGSGAGAGYAYDASNDISITLSVSIDGGAYSDYYTTVVPSGITHREMHIPIGIGGNITTSVTIRLIASVAGGAGSSIDTAMTITEIV